MFGDGDEGSNGNGSVGLDLGLGLGFYYLAAPGQWFVSRLDGTAAVLLLPVEMLQICQFFCYSMDCAKVAETREGLPPSSQSKPAIFEGLQGLHL